jgi:protein-S-isoprenylcysteine O-methyltransferase Ste14
MNENAVGITVHSAVRVTDGTGTPVTTADTGNLTVKTKKTGSMCSISDAFAFRNRGRIGLWLIGPLIVAILFSRPLVAENSLLGILMNFSAWVMFCLYATIRIWATLFIGSRKDSTLQQDGPYSITRNPLYFGTFCFALSAVLLCKSITLAVVMLAGFLFYSRFVIRAEERFLAGRYGSEFFKYREQTPRFIPSFSSFHSPPSVSVSLRDLASETRRIWIALSFPVVLQIAMHLRMSAAWPHWFRIP